MWKANFNASLANCPAAAACIATVLEHFGDAGNTEIHYTGTDDGDMRVRVTNSSGKSRNLFTISSLRSSGYFSCKTYWSPTHLHQPEDGCIQNLRKIANPLATAFNLYPTMEGAPERLISAIDAAIEQWLAGN